jgi:4-hydroxy-2-oxoheptanedioate aldolase
VLFSSPATLPFPLLMRPIPALTFLATLVCYAEVASAQAPAAAAAPRLNRYIELMEAKKPAFGVFSSNVSTRNGAAMASSGLDFVIVDLEHSPFDPTRLEGYLLGMVSKAEIHKKGNLQPGVVPFVRVPAAGREQLQFVIKQVLDLGPMGIVVPHVDTAKDARAMVQACRFPQLNGVPDYEPAGKRGIGYGWAARYWGLSGTEYAERADVWPLDPKGEISLWLMIETKEAVENCLEIARVPGVAGLFIGPSDLAFSLGVPLGDPAVETAIEKIVAVSQQTGVPLGTLCGAGDVEKRLSQGFRFLAVGGDAGPSGGVREAVSIGRKFKPKG